LVGRKLLRKVVNRKKGVERGKEKKEEKQAGSVLNGPGPP